MTLKNVVAKDGFKKLLNGQSTGDIAFFWVCFFAIYWYLEKQHHKPRMLHCIPAFRQVMRRYETKRKRATHRRTSLSVYMFDDMKGMELVQVQPAER